MSHAELTARDNFQVGTGFMIAVPFDLFSAF